MSVQKKTEYAYVIEHMEEDEATPKSLPPWVELEYAHMITLAGQSARVHFTHLSQNSGRSLGERLASLGHTSASFEIHTDSILAVLKEKNVPLSKVCLLDPKAEMALHPDDGQEFEWFLFGGILGDDPPRDRTSELRQLGFPTRHLDSVQMTTDTALGVTKRVIQDQVPLNNIPYIDFPTIKFNAKESVEMPFRYILQNESPLLPPGMRELLQEDLNKSFDF
ncbi:SAM-dependent RNA methyltransferase [Hygrophoropsis aurantiaca]|uniref:SAM-dependent RNA methyltransferase n=1 Tax=Hygrophoropsis aurantiaca TaxID=72124 RepID=A0ACB7ZWU0_9AGAM|nr:SAM-dependent RNA methyltransferase [Hygrophoropsis aurantiaca]